MPVTRGRPTEYPNGPTVIKFTIDKGYHADLLSYAQENGLSVPLYCAMMMCSHVNIIREAARKRKKESTDV